MENGRPGGTAPDRDADAAAESRAMWGTRWKMSWTWGLTALGVYVALFASIGLLRGRSQEVATGAALVALGIHLVYWNEPWGRISNRLWGAGRSNAIAAGIGAIVIGLAFILGVLAS